MSEDKKEAIKPEDNGTKPVPAPQTQGTATPETKPAPSPQTQGTSAPSAPPAPSPQTQGTSAPSAPPAVKKEKPANCAGCNKSIKKKRWYYRDGKYYCTKRCWVTASKKKEEKKEGAPAS
jgi:hypothetical protein